MIHKQIGGKNKQRNVKNSLSYLLRKDKIEEQKHIKVLSTTSEQDILNFNEYIKSKNFAHPYTAGVLSFEEEDIDENLKSKIIADFEEMIFSEIDAENRPPCMWVQHKDKGRLELNYLTFNALADKRAYKTYYHYSDKKLFNAFCEVFNYENNISSVLDVENHKERNTLINTLNNKIPKDKKELINKLQEEIISKIITEDINNRNELIDFLKKEKNIIINREGDNYISIKFYKEDKPVRLKGDIYEQNRDYKTYRTESTIDHRADRKYVKNALREHTGVFDSELRKRASRNKKRFKRAQNENKSSNEQNNKRTNDIPNVRYEISNDNNIIVSDKPIRFDFGNVNFNEEVIINEQNLRINKRKEKTESERFELLRTRIRDSKRIQQSVSVRAEKLRIEQNRARQDLELVESRTRFIRRYADRFSRLFSEIVRRAYSFNRRKTTIEAREKIKQEERLSNTRATTYRQRRP